MEEDSSPSATWNGSEITHQTMQQHNSKMDHWRRWREGLKEERRHAGEKKRETDPKNHSTGVLVFNAEKHRNQQPDGIKSVDDDNSFKKPTVLNQKLEWQIIYYKNKFMQ